jgi:hypothetical protein
MNFADDLPKQFGHKFEPEEKKLLVSKERRVILQIDKDYLDLLRVPGFDDDKNVIRLFVEFQRKKVPLSPEHVCALMHTFVKFNFMTREIFQELEAEAFRHKGEFKTRSVFGALRAGLLHGREQLISFFLNEYRAGNEKFTFQELA